MDRVISILAVASAVKRGFFSEPKAHMLDYPSDLAITSDVIELMDPTITQGELINYIESELDKAGAL